MCYLSVGTALYKLPLGDFFPYLFIKKNNSSGDIISVEASNNTALWLSHIALWLRNTQFLLFFIPWSFPFISTFVFSHYHSHTPQPITSESMQYSKTNRLWNYEWMQFSETHFAFLMQYSIFNIIKWINQIKRNGKWTKSSHWDLLRKRTWTSH